MIPSNSLAAVYGIAADCVVRLREALPFWEKAQEMLRQKLGSRKWPVIMANLNDLIRAA
jgi:hypothetical protein